jgi:hypothetical protein
VDVLRPKPIAPAQRLILLGLEHRKRTRSEEEGKMNQQDKLRAKLVEYVQNVHAMEQNVLLMLDSIILTTRDGSTNASGR